MCHFLLLAIVTTLCLFMVSKYCKGLWHRSWVAILSRGGEGGQPERNKLRWSRSWSWDLGDHWYPQEAIYFNCQRMKKSVEVLFGGSQCCPVPLWTSWCWSLGAAQVSPLLLLLSSQLLWRAEDLGCTAALTDCCPFYPDSPAHFYFSSSKPSLFLLQTPWTAFWLG